MNGDIRTYNSETEEWSAPYRGEIILQGTLNWDYLYCVKHLSLICARSNRNGTSLCLLRSNQCYLAVVPTLMSSN